MRMAPSTPAFPGLLLLSRLTPMHTRRCFVVVSFCSFSDNDDLIEYELIMKVP